MTDDIRKQISDRYYEEYLTQAKQGPGLRAKLARSWPACLKAMACCGAAATAATALAMVAPAVATVALTFSYFSLIAGATIGASATLARHDTAAMARKNISKDIDNFRLLDRYKDDLAADERQKHLAAKTQPARAPVSKREDFDNVTGAQPSAHKNSPAKPAAASRTNQKNNVLK